VEWLALMVHPANQLVSRIYAIETVDTWREGSSENGDESHNRVIADQPKDDILMSCLLVKREPSIRYLKR